MEISILVVDYEERRFKIKVGEEGFGPISRFYNVYFFDRAPNPDYVSLQAIRKINPGDKIEVADFNFIMENQNKLTELFRQLKKPKLGSSELNPPGDPEPDVCYNEHCLDMASRDLHLDRFKDPDPHPDRPDPTPEFSLRFKFCDRCLKMFQTYFLKQPEG